MYFIIGTDTGVGKTQVAKKLAFAGKNVIKPIETGKNSFTDLSESDSHSLAKIQNKDIKDVNLYFLEVPCSPHYAAQLDNLKIDLNKVKDFIVNQGKETYVELAGGLLVPITNAYTQLDLIKELNGEVVLVIGNKLGAINHALLTLNVLKTNNIKIKEVVFNNYSQESEFLDNAMETIIKLGGLENALISVFSNEDYEKANQDC